MVRLYLYSFHHRYLYFMTFFQSQLVAARQRNADQFAFPRNQFRIRRNRIFEDGFNQLTRLNEEELKGMVCIELYYLPEHQLNAL